jgi:transcriptional regulator with XRE-family HTH domain
MSPIATRPDDEESVARRTEIELGRSSAGDRVPTLKDARVGRQIKELRRAAGRTQKQIADAIGVTGAQFHRYETGATRVAASRLLAIAAALGTRPEALIGTGGSMIPSVPLQSYGVTSTGFAELAESYNSISDPRRRLALIQFARVVAKGPDPDTSVSAYESEDSSPSQHLRALPISHEIKTTEIITPAEREIDACLNLLSKTISDMNKDADKFSEYLTKVHSILDDRMSSQ